MKKTKVIVFSCARAVEEKEGNSARSTGGDRPPQAPQASRKRKMAGKPDYRKSFGEILIKKENFRPVGKKDNFRDPQKTIPKVHELSEIFTVLKITECTN